MTGATNGYKLIHSDSIVDTLWENPVL